MNAVDLFSLRFALASGACLAAGVGVWGVTALCRRCFPALALQRSHWLLAQCLVAATFILVLLPHTQYLRAVPVIEIGDAATPPVATPNTAPASSVVQAAASRTALPVIAARAWLVVYLLGLAIALLRLLQGQLALARLARSGTVLHRGDAHAGFPDGSVHLPVIEVAAPISPMLLGLFRPRLLLPLHLRTFDPVQQQLIIEHEMTHWRRGDLVWMSMSLVLQGLFWFHPVMRLLRARLSWAQELACDRAVLHGRAPQHGKAYAAALVAQLKLQSHAMPMTLAFGGARPDSLAARLHLMRVPLAPGRSMGTRGLALLALLAVFAGNLALQPALAWQGNASEQIDCTDIIDAGSGARLLRQGVCDQRVTPASTFNIVVSLMGFDSGYLVDAHTPRLPFKPGYVDWNDNWRIDTDPATWITNSTVWYAQQVTQQVGAPRLSQYLEQFDYGNRDASGDPGKGNGLMNAWIGSSMQISPDEQVAFLRKLVNRQLPVTAHAHAMTAALLKLPVAPGGWTVYGKTGTASPRLPDGSEDTAHSYGWFVGWATKGDRTVVFARLLRATSEKDSAAGPRVKAAFLRDLPARLETI